MNRSEEIRIRPVSGPSKAWLKLQGSVLTYRQPSWTGEKTVDIPVELVTFQETKRFEGARLVHALLALFIPIVGGLLVMTLWEYFFGRPPPWGTEALGLVVLAGVLLFPVLLVRFFIRQKAALLQVAPHVPVVSFWLEKKHEDALRQLMEEVRRRKAWVTEPMERPVVATLQAVIQPPWKRMVALTFLFLLPSLFTENPWLLLLGPIPIGWYLYEVAQRAQQPREFRRALRLCRRRDWQAAQEVLIQLIQRRPAYRPARMLLIELLLWLEDFAGAAAALAGAEDELDAETLQTARQEILRRTKIAGRKKQTPSDPLSISS